MEKFVVSISNCGEAETKFIAAHKLSDIQKVYLLECISETKKKREELLNLDDEKINELFKYMFTGGEGYQSGNPGKEWVSIDIKNLNDCKFENLKTIKF